jgi:hypothetical protein
MEPAPAGSTKSNAKKRSVRPSVTHVSGDLCTNVPAAALRGLLSGLSGCVSLYAAQSESSITASPRTSTRPPAATVCGSPSTTRRALSVTRSPSRPSPRVATYSSAPSR